MEHNYNTIETYSTSDFYLACYLKYLDYKIVRLEGSGRHRIFVFADDIRREDDLLSYFNNDASVEPLQFTNTIRDMKGLMYKE